MYEAFLWLVRFTYERFFAGQDLVRTLVAVCPFVVFMELPVYAVVLLGLVRGRLRADVRAHGRRKAAAPRRYFPPVSCIISCYSEGRDVVKTIRSVMGQMYPGRIQILAVIDGAAANRETREAALSMVATVNRTPKRELKVVPKWQRGGRVSSLNAGMLFADGEIVIAMDGDTSFDNNMVWNVTRHFEDGNVFAVAGGLRVRNAFRTIVTRLQAVEYFLSINATKLGLSEFNMVNNISGAFGAFRRSVLDAVMGWDAGTAEDLDMTLRIKSYMGRHKGMRIVYDKEAMGHTDVPETLRGILKQRQRWDGDLAYLYCRKHPLSISPKLVGWKNFTYLLVNGLVIQVVMPFLIILYMLVAYLTFPAHMWFALALLTYGFYAAITLGMLLFSIPFASERPLYDIKLAPWALLAPLYGFAIRLNCALAILWEFVGRGHDDSSMAPWWTLKKSKF
ncbi:MAG: glycosyltransferase family 2 protein [Acidobacteriota bacterium]|jgi:cellulose synthase/poly-beta-1,6-N-acetylglucosamine synthase-like glycosyltransferase|nr:glycosyltransferase family 2 protein [Acidobacteriota bacterium]